jgi:hypothetical protein
LTAKLLITGLSVEQRELRTMTVPHLELESAIPLGFVVLMAKTMKRQIFWDVTLISLIEIH